MKVPTVPPVMAVVELPTVKPARLFPEPSVMAAAELVILTVVPVGFEAG